MTALLTGDLGVVDPSDLAVVDTTHRELGFVALRGLLSEAEVDEVEAQCVAAQEDVAAGPVTERYGSAAFLNAVARHPAVQAFAHLDLGPDAWLLHGWHSDWQSAPSRAVWPGTAFTLHVNGTIPANGFLRVVPGSDRWATPAPYRDINAGPLPEGSRPWGGHTDATPPFPIPLGFDKVPGEIARYLKRGDLLLHDAYVWHSAARATDDASRRRHLRGSWFAHPEPAREPFEEFVKNAAR